MHRIYSAVVILIITAATIVFGFVINTSASKSVTDKVGSAESYALIGDVDGAKKEIKSALDEWQGKMEIMLIFISHGRLDRIEESLNNANTYIEFGEINAFTAECRKAEILLEHFHAAEYPTVNNIL